MENINELPTRTETIAAYIVLATLVGMMFVCGWMIYSSFSSWILF